MSYSVNDRGVGVAVSINVSPNKLVNPGDSGKGMNRRECSVAIITEHGGQAACRPQDNVEVAVCLNVHGPRACVVAAECCPRQPCLPSNIDELCCIALLKKAQ